MKHCVGLVSVGLCVLSLGCGGSNAGDGADSSAGSSAAGAAPGAGGGSASAGASQSNAGASAGGDTSLPSGAGGRGRSRWQQWRGHEWRFSGRFGWRVAGGRKRGACGQRWSAGTGSEQAPWRELRLDAVSLCSCRCRTATTACSRSRISPRTRRTTSTPAPDGAMTFWCPVTGAHTMNTHYPRTELREKRDRWRLGDQRHSQSDCDVQGHQDSPEQGHDHRSGARQRNGRNGRDSEARMAHYESDRGFDRRRHGPFVAIRQGSRQLCLERAADLHNQIRK